ncbi:MAG: aldolase [Ruminococcaceae bacterium]|nr:aldolase [Oscillospiraceae bacterium]
MRNKIKNKEKTVGMYVQLCDITNSRIAGLVGYDFVWVDTEHSFMSYETLLNHIIALKSTGTPVIVRAPQNDLTATKKILEIGVDGIIFPMIKSAKEANKAIASTLYPPYGNRGFGPMNAVDYGLKDVGEYIKNTKSELMRFIQIEHKDAIEDLDEIMKNPYIDGYIFGANDLSGSYDMLGDIYSEKIVNVMKDTIKRLHDNGKYVGIASGGCTEKIIKHWADMGTDMIIAGADFDFIREGARQNLANLKRIHLGK